MFNRSGNQLINCLHFDDKFDVGDLSIDVLVLCRFVLLSLLIVSRSIIVLIINGQYNQGLERKQMTGHIKTDNIHSLY